MATTDYDYLLTRNEIIQRAFQKVGALTLGEVLSAEQIDQGAKEINEIVKHWQNKRIFLWSLQKTTQLLVVGTVSYSLASKLDGAILWLDRVWLTEASNSEEQLVRTISWRDYQSIPDKEESSGTVTHVAYDTRNQTLYVYPKPSVADTLSLICCTKLKDFDTAGGSGDIPVQWQEALTLSLTANLADNYGLPLSERKYFQGKAEIAFMEAARMDRERADYEFVDGAF